MRTRMTERPVGAMEPGDHAAFCFASSQEQARVIGPFLQDGLAAGEKVLYISSVPPRELPGLRCRPDAEHAAETGQLRVIPKAAACRVRGRFDPDQMNALLGPEITHAAEQGYPAVRITGDMSWVLNDPGGFPMMLATEAGFEEAMGLESPIIAICQFDRNRCSHDRLSALTHGHQLRVTANPEYDDGVLRIIRNAVLHGLRLAGELDAARHKALSAALTSLGTVSSGIHLDFADVDFVDLGTLDLLVRHALHAPPGHVLILNNLPAEAAGVIETLGWHHFPGLIPGCQRPL